jgi:hypothetical protein
MDCIGWIATADRLIFTNKIAKRHNWRAGVSNFWLNQSAKDGYRTYLQPYARHSRYGRQSLRYLGRLNDEKSHVVVSKSSYFLGDPPPDPRFLASLGTLSLVELDLCSGWTGPKEPATIVWPFPPGGQPPRPPVARFARTFVCLPMWP